MRWLKQADSARAATWNTAFVYQWRTRPRCSVRVAPYERNPTPTATLSVPTASTVSALAVDSAGNVAVGDIGGNISIFNAPVTGSASASATFKNGTATSVENLAFNSAGDLFATTFSNSINVFTHPLTSASTPSQVITSVNLTSSVGIVLDSANNLIVSNSLPGPTASNLLVYAPPYTGLPIATVAVPAASYR